MELGQKNTELSQTSEKTTFLDSTKDATNPKAFESEPSASDDNDLAPPKRVREQWVNKIDFLFACVGFSVGLGNVWRFPYLCYKNGGGAFLLPYFTCAVLGGIPLFFLEVALGQFMSCGGIRAWNICPLFQGIGFATTVIIFALNTYYNVILSWGFYYLFASFTSVLPWSTCNNEWNSCACRSVYGNDTNQTTILRPECHLENTTNITNYVDSVDEYWQRNVLQLSPGIDQPGAVKWDLTLCLLLAWIVVYFCIWKGIKSSGKVMYFTASAPYALMTVLLVRGATLDGAMDGVSFYMKPDFQKIGDMQVWVDAGTQIFFSYSIGLGTLLALGSYNRFNHNSFKDCFIFACINSGTSLFAGFVIFSILGFMAKQQGVHVGEVASSGPGLAFIAYPKALTQLPLSPFWSVLFFVMIILLGLDSQFVGVEGFITAITDVFPSLFKRKWFREIFTAGVCFVSFLIGLSMVSEGGVYVFQLFDYYFISRNVVIIGFVECIAIAWFYGIDRFTENLEMMFGFKMKIPIFKIAWILVSPVFILVMFVLGCITYSELTYNRDYIYPMWAVGIGWAMSLVAILVIPITMVVKIAFEHGTLVERIRKLMRPRLRPHQLRPSDDPADLDSEMDESEMVDEKDNTSEPLTYVCKTNV